MLFSVAELDGLGGGVEGEEVRRALAPLVEERVRVLSRSGGEQGAGDGAAVRDYVAVVRVRVWSYAVVWGLTSKSPSESSGSAHGPAPSPGSGSGPGPGPTPASALGRKGGGEALFSPQGGGDPRGWPGTGRFSSITI